jgi:O-antigen ligase
VNHLFLSDLIHDLRLRINVERWIRVLIIVGVLIASSLLVFVASRRLITLLLVALVGLGGILALLRWPPLGLLGILFGGIFLGFSGPGGFNAAILGVALVTGLWLLEMIVRNRRIQFVPSPTTVPILVFMVSALISFGIGQLSWYPLANKAPMTAQLGGLIISILSAGAFLMVANQIKDLRWLKTITWAFILIGGLYILVRLVPELGRIERRFFQGGAVAGSLFWVWLVVLPLSQAIFNRELSLRWRAALSGLVLATLYVAMTQGSGWKSGYIPPLAGAAVIIGFRLKQKVLIFIPVGIILAGYVLNQAIATDQYSYSTRLEAWQIVLEISKVNPITGLGFANYYWYTPLFPIRGYAVVFNSHSQYVDMIAQTGLFGLACFAWVFWSIGRLGWSLRNRVPEGFAKAYLIGALGGLVGTLVAGGFVDWILPFVYNIGMNGFRSSILAWIFLGGLVSIEQIAKLQSNSQTTGN